ncbi:hypothetical protein [Pseudogulbenkiania ferrooxidans]|uniref:hypothetical protein n=1 Tax=Pseudogulbenkiania ferrooxidans TaxID=549169 RepID=UPI00135F19B7|nr:hypothetical protein [Pseudogulbenkiania ferrooxidans]
MAIIHNGELFEEPERLHGIYKKQPDTDFSNRVKEARGLFGFEQRQSFPVKPPFACGGGTLAPHCVITALGIFL